MKKNRKGRKKEETMDAQCPCLSSFLWDFTVCHDGPDLAVMPA